MLDVAGSILRGNELLTIREARHERTSSAKSFRTSVRHHVADVS
jgi:hypothetical protein